MRYWNIIFKSFSVLLLFLGGEALSSEEPILLDTTVIRANKELPKVMYMVPWQQQSQYRKKQRQRLKLHSLFGDTFDPVIPEKPIRHSSVGE
jgi:hypothetical protein